MTPPKKKNEGVFDEVLDEFENAELRDVEDMEHPRRNARGKKYFVGGDPQTTGDSAQKSAEENAREGMDDEGGRRGG
ncbi:hypothetical protein [Streptomyces sp. NPDC003077]|uniref:hypothetical protein n=1 Tax=Streptomyces sp. NPDC003077 TaxID=3154443 RepID=UPI0033A87151